MSALASPPTRPTLAPPAAHSGLVDGRVWVIAGFQLALLLARWRRDRSWCCERHRRYRSTRRSSLPLGGRPTRAVSPSVLRGRAGFVPFRLVMVSPLLVPVWVAGLLAPFRRASWRPLRFVPITYMAMALLYLAGRRSCLLPGESLPAAPRPRRGSHGEAGAIDLLGPKLGLPPAYSAHNGFSEWATPAPQETHVLMAGFDNAPDAAPQFTRCRTLARVDNGVGLDNQEQGLPLMLCQISRPWRTLWPGLIHYD
ncbi:MAG: hypothetical protein ACM3UX_00545 [Candidatus Woesearchaeota archaeon]